MVRAAPFVHYLGNPTNPMKRFVRVLLVVSLLAVVLYWLMPSAVGPVGTSRAKEDWAKRWVRGPVTPAKDPSSTVSNIPGLLSMPGPPPVLTPQPMKLVSNVLARSAWNSGAEAFGQEQPAEGATIGPASVVYAKSNVYVLDTVNGRILGYDKEGHKVSSVELPTKVLTDMFVNAADSSLMLIDQVNNNVYRVNGNETSLLGSAELKNFSVGTRFAYDPATGDVRGEDPGGLAENADGKLVVGFESGKPVTILFDKPVFCVDEAARDGHGNIWVLFTLEGDFRMRRLARVDAGRSTVGVAEIDAWFAFDATRRMAATEDGVVVFAGDDKEGRLLSFDYGGAL